jgi:hypothetical protein
MKASDRRSIRYDQFVETKPRWRRAATLSGVGVLAVAAVAFALFAGGVGQAKSEFDVTPPKALSSAGKPIAGEAYHWARVAIGGGGFISGLAMDPAGKTFLARADVYGAYIWDAARNRWFQLATAPAMPEADRVQNGVGGGGYAIAVAPSRPDRIYMAVTGKVYRSDDRGANWTLASIGDPFPMVWDANGEYRHYGPHLTVDPDNPDLVFFGTPENGLWRTADAGRSWTHVSTVPADLDGRPAEGIQAPGTMIWYERPVGGKPTGRIFAFAAGRGMFVSQDRGVTFSPLPALQGPSPRTLKRGAFDRRGVFFAADVGGNSMWSYAQGRWHNLTQEFGLRSSDYAAVAVDPRSDRVIILDQSGHGYLSPDGGKTWSSVSHSARTGQGEPPWLKVADATYFATSDLMFDPVVANRLWVAAGTGVFFADVTPGDTHLTWVSQARGIEELVANDVIQTPGHAPLFAAWDFGIHIKHDLNAFSTAFAPDRSFIAVQQIDWTPANPAFLVTNASDTRNCCSEDGNSVMAGFSTDGGRTWSKFATLPTPPGTKASDPWRMAFGTIAVSSGDPDNIVWAPSKNRNPYYTVDRGRSWKPVILPGAVGDNPGSFGQDWLQRKTLTADKTTAGVFYLVHSGETPNEALAGLWRSRDGGANWQHIYDRPLAPESRFAAKLRSVPGKAGHLFFTSGVSHAADTALRRSTDGGETWTVASDVTRVDDIAFGKAAPGAGYPALYISGRVSGVYGVWRSIDAAKTWQRLVDFPMTTLDQVSVMGADPDVFGRVYLGYVGSSWIWGEPAPCKPAAARSFATEQCSAVGR